MPELFAEVKGPLEVRSRQHARDVGIGHQQRLEIPLLSKGPHGVALHPLVRLLAGHAAAIESDSGGGRPLGFGVSGGPGAIEIVRRLAAPLASFAADDVRDGGGGADISPMAPSGVPQLGLRQDTTHYFDVHHTIADTLDKIDPHDLAMNATAMAVMAWQLAELDAPLPRYVPSKTEDKAKPPGIR